MTSRTGPRPIASATLAIAALTLCTLQVAHAILPPAAPDASVVSPSTGAAQLRIAIELPPAPGALSPELALVYSSQAGDGPFGVGWQLTLGEIRCATRFGVIPVGGDCPRYELNGRLLTPAATTHQGGEVITRYHALEESFVRIEHYETSEHWLLTQPDGTRLRFGGSGTVHIDDDPSQPAYRWLLAEVRDPYENRIDITWSADPDGSGTPDPGMRYPISLSYAGGARRVDFFYEERPDPIRGYPGGVERAITRRGTEIRVSSNGSVIRRQLLGYDLADLGRAPTDADYTTGRSRLSWTQHFGLDCPDDPAPLQSCTGLPPQTFRYSDSGDPSATGPGQQEVWESPGWSAPVALWPDEIHFSYWNNPLGEFGEPMRVGDVNGDGLDDILIAGSTDASVDWQLPRVYLNNGRDGWYEDPAWSSALEAIKHSYPRARVEAWQVSASDPVGNPVFAICGATIHEVTGDIVMPTLTGLPGYPDNLWPLDLGAPGQPGFWPSTNMGEIWGYLDPPHLSRLEFGGWFQLVDVDDDGLADLVSSVRVGYATQTLDDCENQNELAPEDYVLSSHETRVVFRNTGSGWVRDDALAAGLPTLGTVNVESVHRVSELTGGALCNFVTGGAGMFGYRGVWPLPPNYGDFCILSVSRAPRFVDFNGDGYLDVIVTVPEDEFGIQMGNHGGCTETSGNWALPCNPATSRAWVQNPEAGPGEDRWVPAPEFDLGWPHVFHSRGHSCSQGQLFCNWSATNDVGVRFLDINLDGLADALWNDPYPPPLEPELGPWKEGDGPPQPFGVYINTGRGWCPSFDGCEWARIYTPPQLAERIPFAGGESTSTIGYLTSLNGDAFPDLVWMRDASTHWTVGAFPWSASDSRWVSDDAFTPTVAISQKPYRILDMNGDGILDFHHPEKPDLISKLTPESAPPRQLPDRVEEHANGRGGTIGISYASAATQRDPDPGPAGLETLALADAVDPALDPAEPPGGAHAAVRWRKQPVVTRTVVKGPNRSDAATTYRYAHPRSCPEHRMGLGFRLTERGHPDGSSDQSYFYQQHGRAGRLSARGVFDTAGDLIAWEEADWELPPGPIPGSLPPGAESFVGRLRETRSALYDVATGHGAQTTRTLSYDDEHGYNFVSRILEDRPSGALRTERIPAAANAADWVVQRVAERREYQHESGDASDRLLGRTSFTYHRTAAGRATTQVATRSDWVRERRDPGPGEVETSTLAYDDRGNLSSRSRQVGGQTRTTRFCYDGDPGCEPGHDSHSMQVRVEDPQGRFVRSQPHAAFPLMVSVDSDYVDQPTELRSYDAFGRLVLEELLPEGGVPLTERETLYFDENPPTVPYREVRSWVDGIDPDNAVRSWVFEDGFGGPWKTLKETPPNVGGAEHFGSAVYLDPVAGIRRETLPIECVGDFLCQNLTGATEAPAVETELDSLGRATRVTNPDGSFEVVVHGTGPLPQPHPPALASARFDIALQKNAKGDLTRRYLDGARAVLVEECHDTPDPGLDHPLPAGLCLARDRSFTTFEATGEISTAYTPEAAATGDFLDPDHFLHYELDSLGRVVEVSDPDADGPSTTGYDEAGNVAIATDARGLQLRFHYDALDRLTRIDRPEGEEDVSFGYDDAAPLLAVASETTSDALPCGGSIACGDSDLDGVSDAFDNCTQVANGSQCDTDGDGFGSHCDGDFNQNGSVTGPDFSAFAAAFTAGSASADWNCNGSVTGPDFPIFASAFTSGLGPSAVSGSYWKTYAYDGLGRVREVQRHVVGAGLLIHTTERDLLGRPVEITHPLAIDGLPLKTRYEYAGEQLLRVCDPGAGPDCSTAPRYTYLEGVDYDGIGRRTRMQLPMGDRNLAYDPLSQRLIEDGFNLGGNGYWVRFEYLDYDGLGNVLELRGTSQPDDIAFSAQYGYDARNRIGSWHYDGHTYEFEYDALGNLTLHADRLQHYTDPGRPHAMTSRQDGSVTLAYQYDAAGQLASIHRGGSSEHFGFDASGRLVCKGGSAASCELLEVLYDAEGDRLKERDPDGMRLFAGDDFVYEPGAGLSWIQVRAFGERIAYAKVSGGALRGTPSGGSASGFAIPRWVLSDRVGSGVVVLDGNGARWRHSVYEPFGRLATERASGSLRHFFGGHPEQPSTGLYFMKARWMDPDSGTFLSIDPLFVPTDPQSHTAYAYARNNPVSFNDPTGELAPAAIILIGGGIGGLAAWATGADVAHGIKAGALSAVGGNLVNLGTALAGVGSTATRALGNAAVGGRHRGRQWRRCHPHRHRSGQQRSRLGDGRGSAERRNPGRPAWRPRPGRPSAQRAAVPPPRRRASCSRGPRSSRSARCR